MKNNTFKIILKDSHFGKDDILLTTQGRVLTKPKKCWYKLLAQYVTFGRYQAPWEYTVDTRYVAGIDPYDTGDKGGSFTVNTLEGSK